MKVLLLNQCFYPDIVSTAQHLTDLALELTKQGHEVTVIAGRQGYDGGKSQFAARETYQGVKIIRIRTLALGKSSRWRRALNFGIFLLNLAARLLLTRRQDAVIALTSPPLISYLGALFVRLKGGRFYFWAMDLNPDEAIAAGWLRKDSRTAEMLESFLRYSLRHSEKIFVLDRFVKQRVLAKGISAEKLLVVPPWSHDTAIEFDETQRNAFRATHGLSEKFVVMYSGNHSPCHPLDTLLGAAEALKTNKQIVFCFVGGGSEKQKVEQFASSRALANIKCLPYQPLKELSASLSAADLHLVVMGDPFVGIVHPCKLYNILQIDVPVLYIGPAESHVTDVVAEFSDAIEFYGARHGEVETVVNHIVSAARERRVRSGSPKQFLATFSSAQLIPRMIEGLQDPAVDLVPAGSSELAPL